jgi:hypothetical protein
MNDRMLALVIFIIVGLAAFLVVASTLGSQERNRKCDVLCGGDAGYVISCTDYVKCAPSNQIFIKEVK